MTKNKRLLIALISLSVASLTGCSPSGVDNVPASQRFTAQGVSIQGFGGTAYIIKDVKTGKEFLVIHMGYGLAVTPL